jgi:hypothetical protein
MFIAAGGAGASHNVTNQPFLHNEPIGIAIQLLNVGNLSSQ